MLLYLLHLVQSKIRGQAGKMTREKNLYSREEQKVKETFAEVQKERSKGKGPNNQLVDESLNQIWELRREKDELQDQLTNPGLDSEEAQIQRAMDNVKEQITAAAHKHKRELVRVKAQTKGQVRDFDSEVKDLESTLSHLNEQVKGLQAKVSKTEAEQQKYEKEKEKLEDEYQKAKQAHEEVMDEKSQLLAKLGEELQALGEKSKFYPCKHSYIVYRGWSESAISKRHCHNDWRFFSST